MRLKKELRGSFNEKKIVLKIVGNELQDGVGNIINIPPILQKYVEWAKQDFIFDGQSYILLRQVVDTTNFLFRPLKRWTVDTCFTPESDINLHPKLKNFVERCFFKSKKRIEKRRGRIDGKKKDGRQLSRSMVDEEGNYNPKWTPNVIFGYERGE